MTVFTWIVLLLMALGGLVWLYALIDCLTNEPNQGNDRVVWLLVILLANLPGALIYLLIRRPQRLRQASH